MNQMLYLAMLADALVTTAQRHILRYTIMERCDKEELGDCWVWQLSTDGRYGIAYFGRDRIKAHVLAFLVWGGMLKRHQVVDHLCNNTLCCRPCHLRACTQSENIARAFAEGRGRSTFMKRQDNDISS